MLPKWVISFVNFFQRLGIVEDDTELQIFEKRVFKTLIEPVNNFV